MAAGKPYRDYAEESEFFHDDNKKLQEELNAVEKQKNYVIWIQEFSKVIVIATFILYIITCIFSALVVFISFKSGYVTGIDSLISETNNTFRDIVGGYIIKSAVENAIKIGGNYYIGIADAKLNIMREQMNMKSNFTQNNNDYREEPSTVEDEYIEDEALNQDC